MGGRFHGIIQTASKIKGRQFALLKEETRSKLIHLNEQVSSPLNLVMIDAGNIDAFLS